jgi:hypothetical protein
MSRALYTLRKQSSNVNKNLSLWTDITGACNMQFHQNVDHECKFITMHDLTGSCSLEVKVKFTLEWAMNAQRESRCISLLFL